MPTYEYECAGCGHEFEIFQNMSDDTLKKCPQCKKNRLKRKIGIGAGIIFKGDGFYCTDYRSEDYKKEAKKDKTTTSSTSDSGSDSTSKSESKDSSKNDKKSEKKSKKDMKKAS